MEKMQSKLYPERSSSNVSEKVDNIEKVISGEIPTWEISETERSEILDIESNLAQAMESIYSISPKGVSFNLGYFLTEEGKEDFLDVTGLELPPSLTDFRDLKRFLYSQSELFSESNRKSFAEMTGRSSKFREKQLADELVSTIDDIGNIDTSMMSEGGSVSIRLTPELDYEKSKRLRDFKLEIKRKRMELEESTFPQDYIDVLGGIYDLYQRRINEIIAQNYSDFITIAKKAEFVGEEKLTNAERLALSENVASNEVSRNLSRRDKFLYGTSEDFDDNGWAKQVASELTLFADEQEKVVISNALEKSQGVTGKGLDEKMLTGETIAVSEIQRMGEETLAHYDLLSSVPSSEYVPGRSGPAEDGKWQFVVSDSYQSLSVDGTQKIVKCPNKPQSISRLLSVSIAHEIEGHVLQHENRSKIPLRLFAKIGADRSSIFAEAGAMSNQDYLTDNAFGYNEGSHPNYVRAMVAKLEGGDYSDCLRAFYLSDIKSDQIKHEQGQLDNDAFLKACKTKLKIAINRTGRLFRGGMSRSDTSSFLAESKSTVYLEQIKLASELKERGLDKLLSLTRVNFQAIEFLLRAKLINLDDIKSPDFYALEIWDRVKGDYALGAAELS